MMRLKICPTLLTLLGVIGVWNAGFSQSATRPAVTPPAPPPNTRPAILLILTDDLGYGDLGCYGQRQIKTPHLDRMAAEGLRFTDFYAGSTVCAPSRAALMLGRHTGHLNLRGNIKGGTLLPGEITVAEVLQRAGYATGLIGKWGLAAEGLPGVPQKKGFEQFLGYLENVHAHDYYPEYLWRFDPDNQTDGRIQLPGNEGGARGDYVPDLCTRAALNFIRINTPDRFNQYRPFFLLLSYTTPHAHNALGRRTGNGMEVPTNAPYTHLDWPEPEKNKAAMITRLDADIGRILQTLRTNPALTNTLVLFTSDNGPHAEGGVDPKFLNSSGPLRGHKRDLTEGGIRVPLIAWWPGRVPAGKTTDFPAALWDLFPTFAELARTSAPEGLDGISLVPLLTTGQQTNRHDLLYWEFHERGFQQAGRMGGWKGIRPAPDAPLELYDLATDIGETNNVAAQHPDVVAQIESRLKAARTESEQWPIKPATAKKAAP